MRSFITVLESCGLLVIIPLQIIYIICYPLFLYFGEFLPPYTFFLNAFGIMPIPKDIQANLNGIRNEGITIIIRFVISYIMFLVFMQFLNP
jgi:hypothetical protein